MEYYSCKNSKVDIFLEIQQIFLEQFRATSWVSQVVICLMFNLWCLMFQVWYFGVFLVKLNLFHVSVADHEQIFFLIHGIVTKLVSDWEKNMYIYVNRLEIVMFG